MMCVRVCICVHEEAQDWWQVSSSVFSTLYIEASLFLSLKFAISASIAGQFLVKEEFPFSACCGLGSQAGHMPPLLSCGFCLQSKDING